MTAARDSPDIHIILCTEYRRGPFEHTDGEGETRDRAGERQAYTLGLTQRVPSDFYWL